MPAKEFVFKIDLNGVASWQIRESIQSIMERMSRVRVCVYYWMKSTIPDAALHIPPSYIAVLSENSFCGNIQSIKQIPSSGNEYEITVTRSGMLGALLDEDSITHLRMVPVVDSFGWVSGFVIVRKKNISPTKEK